LLFFDIFFPTTLGQKLGSKNGGEACFHIQKSAELRQKVFPSLPLLEKYVGHCKKKKNKKVLLFFCPNSFDYNVFGLESFIELIFLISSIDT